MLTKSTTGTVALFSATDPRHLLDRVREQDLTAQRVIEELQKKRQIAEQEITIYEGAKGMRAFSLKNAAALEPGEDICVLGSGGEKFERAMGTRALKNYFDLIDERGGAKVLFYQTQQYSQGLYSRVANRTNIQTRVIPFDITPSAGVVFTSRSVAFHLYEDPMSVIEVANPHLVEAYKAYFALLWEQRVRITYGEDAVKAAFYEIVDALSPGHEYYSIGTNSREMAEMFDTYHQYRVQKGVGCKLLSYQADTQGIRERYAKAGDPEGKISHVKSLARTAIGPIQITMYGGRVLIPIYGSQPAAIVFDDGRLYDGFKQFFDELWNQSSQLLSGPECIEQLCQEVLAQGKDLYLIAATGSIMKTHPEYYQKFTKQREAAGIKLRMLANESIRDSAFTKLPLSQVRYLPPVFESPMVVWIFGDYVANVLWQEPQRVFLTQDKNIADSYRQYYHALEKTAKL